MLNLKGEARRSDTGWMLFSAHTAPARPATELRSVRRSLNTPVLAIAQLPVGPASAVIATHVDSADGFARYTLAVRCERSREVVFFAAREEDLARPESRVAAEAALSLAEGMGFLFEEESLPIAAEAACAIWEEYADSASSYAADAEPRPAPLLTKFRRFASQLAADSASVGGSKTTPHPAALGADSGVEGRIARQGDR